MLLVHPWDLFGNDLFLQGFISKKDSFNFTLLLTRTVSEKKPLLKVWKKIHPGRLQSCDPPPVWKCPRGFCWDLGTRGCRTAWLGFTSSVKFLKEILKKKVFSVPVKGHQNLGVRFPGVSWNQQHGEATGRGSLVLPLSFRRCFLLYFYVH